MSPPPVRERGKQCPAETYSVEWGREKINNCIAKKESIYMETYKDEYKRQKIFILVKEKLIWLIAKNVKSNFKALRAKLN